MTFGLPSICVTFKTTFMKSTQLVKKKNQNDNTYMYSMVISTVYFFTLKEEKYVKQLWELE
jgi:hypothetical protein